MSITYQLNEVFGHLGGYRRVFFREEPVVDYIASVNGLVLKLDKEDKLSLINPILEESLNIPGCFMHFPSRAQSCTVWYGLGYNPIHDDYIVVRMVNFHVHRALLHVQDYYKSVEIYSILTTQNSCMGYLSKVTYIGRFIRMVPILSLSQISVLNFGNF